MAFADAAIDPRVLMIANTTERANVKSAINTAHTSLLAVVVTTVGRTAADAEWVDIEDKLLELAEQVSVAIADYPA